MLHSDSTTIPGNVLTLQGFGVAFGEVNILSDIDLALPAKGIDVVMGPPRSGKSMLLSTLAGRHDSNPAFRSWGRKLSANSESTENTQPPVLVRQHAAILGGTVRDALLFHLHHNITCQRVADEYFVNHILHAYELKSHVGSPDALVISLPSEWKRAINILSHALMEPSILLLDEPTKGLDPAAGSRLINWLKLLSRHNTRLLVSMRSKTQARKLADRIILMGSGRVLAHESNPAFFLRPANQWSREFVDNDDGMDDEPLSEAVEPISGHNTTGTPAHATNAQAARQPMRTRKVSEDADMVGRIRIKLNQAAPSGFHWIIPGKLASCAAPGVFSPENYDLELLQSEGITHLMTLTRKTLDKDKLHRYGLSNLHLPIYDKEAPSITQAHMLVRKMQTLLSDDHVVALHCKAGLGRTGTVLACWLMHETNLEVKDVLGRLRSINPGYVSSQAQEKFLYQFESDLDQRAELAAG